MLNKYNDTPAAIALGIFALGGLFYEVQTIFMTESWLLANELSAEAIVVTRVMGAAFLGLTVGLLLTFLKGPDGQRILFTGILVAQIGTLLVLWHSHFVLSSPSTLDDAIIVSVLTALLLFGYVRIQSRL